MRQNNCVKRNSKSRQYSEKQQKRFTIIYSVHRRWHSRCWQLSFSHIHTRLSWNFKCYSSEFKGKLKLASPARKFTIRQIENKFFSNKSGACYHIFKVKNYTLIYSFYADQVLNSAEKQIFSLNRYSLLEYILKISANGGPVWATGRYGELLAETYCMNVLAILLFHHRIR